MSEKKAVITKKTIAKELMSENTKSLGFYLIIIGAWFAFIGLLFWGFYFLVLQERDVTAFGWIVYFACMLVFLLPSLIFIMLIPALLSERKKLKNLDFFVFTDEVTRKEEKNVIRRGNIYIENTIHFYKYGDVHIKNKTWYQLTEENDTYYIVVSSKASDHPQKYYPTKIYEYQE